MTTQKKARPNTTANRPAAAKAARAPAGRAAAATGRPRRRARTATPDHATIAERAYFIGLAGGADPVTNWLRAERELARAA